jgi:hypothetical protein
MMAVQRLWRARVSGITTNYYAYTGVSFWACYTRYTMKNELYLNKL